MVLYVYFEWLKIEDIILSYKVSEDYINLTKNEKRKLNIWIVFIIKDGFTILEMCC